MSSGKDSLVLAAFPVMLPELKAVRYYHPCPEVTLSGAGLDEVFQADGVGLLELSLELK